MVSAVFRHPPGVTDPHEQVGQCATGPVIAWARGENRSVRSFMCEKRILREDDAQCRRHEQLEPALPQKDEARDHPAERDRDDAEDDPIVSSGTSEKPSFSDGTQ